MLINDPQRPSPSNDEATCNVVKDPVIVSFTSFSRIDRSDIPGGAAQQQSEDIHSRECRVEPRGETSDLGWDRR